MCDAIVLMYRFHSYALNTCTCAEVYGIRSQ